MKVTRSLMFALALSIVLVISCKQSRETEEKAVATEEVGANSSESEAPVQGNSLSSSAAQVSKQESKRKFIRTADLKFKVKDVIKTTYKIENITSKHGGFVAYTNLQSDTYSEGTNKISADSSVITRHFTVRNEMILRVPNIQLDSTLKAIAPLVDYLDFRVIKADDVSLKILSNDMSRTRSKQTEKRLTAAIDTKGKRLNDITNAEDNLAAKIEQADAAKLDNLSIQDQINFSTVTIAMYQREEIRREVIANDKQDSRFQQGFGGQLWDSLQTGWEIIRAVVVFLTQLWALIAIAIIVYLFYKKRKQDKAK